MKNKLLVYTWAALIVLFIWLSINVLSGHMQRFNDIVYMQIEKWINPLLTNFMIIISNIGEWFVYVPISLLFLLIPKSRIKIGIPVTLAFFATVFLNIILKHMFAVTRPDIHRLISESGYGYPSFHAMNSIVYIGLCAYLFVRYSYKRPLKIFVILLSFVFMVLMGCSRIYLGVHNPTDILAGYLAGGVILTSSIFILQREGLVVNLMKYVRGRYE